MWLLKIYKKTHQSDILYDFLLDRFRVEFSAEPELENGVLLDVLGGDLSIAINAIKIP